MIHGPRHAVHGSRTTEHYSAWLLTRGARITQRDPGCAAHGKVSQVAYAFSEFGYPWSTAHGGWVSGSVRLILSRAPIGLSETKGSVLGFPRPGGRTRLRTCAPMSVSASHPTTASDWKQSSSHFTVTRSRMTGRRPGLRDTESDPLTSSLLMARYAAFLSVIPASRSTSAVTLISLERCISPWARRTTRGSNRSGRPTCRETTCRAHAGTTAIS